jgi:hypothetical protein
MTTDGFLGLLDGVRATSRGWSANCPAHLDRHPSLSIAEGRIGLLVHCWVGCSPDEIFRALGLGMRDLFYETEPDPHKRCEAQRQREARGAQETAVARTAGRLIDARREAENLTRLASGIDISSWSSDQLHCALNKLGDAYDVLEAERVKYGRD